MALFNLGSPNIQKLKDKKDIDGLIKALDYKPKRPEDSNIPVLAASALAEIGNARSVEALIAFSEGGISRKETVAEVLGCIHNADAAKPLIAALEHRLDYVRQAALEALVRLNNSDPKVIQALIASMVDSDPKVRADALRTLYSMYRADVDRRINNPKPMSEMRVLPEAIRGKEAIFAQELLSFAVEHKDFVDQALAHLFFVPKSEEGRKDMLRRMLVFGEHSVKGMALCLGDFNTADALQTVSVYATKLLRNFYEQSSGEVRSRIVDQLIEMIYERRNQMPGPLPWFLAELGDKRADKVLVAAQNYIVYPSPGSRDPLFQLRGEKTFQFRNGKQARIPKEVGLLCEQFPEDGIYHFVEGHFENWLADIGRPDLAERCRKLRLEGGDPEESLKRFAIYCDAKESYKLIKPETACSVCGQAKFNKTRYWEKDNRIQWVGRCPECNTAFCVDHAVFDQELGDYVCPEHRLRLRLHELES